MLCYAVSLFLCFFFFKQKTAYEMRISDWSSDVCSSDLIGLAPEELRLRNFIAPQSLPYTTAFGETYDSGDFPGMLKRGFSAIDHPGFHARRKEAAAKGPIRGPRLACSGQVCGSHIHETAPPVCNEHERREGERRRRQ